MNFSVLTIFPEMFVRFWEHGMIKRAIASDKIRVATVNIRDFAAGKHRVTDDRPYGGGCGMVMKPEPLAGAIRAAQKEMPDAKRILLTPQGRLFDQGTARELMECNGLILVCGRYEGVDERISRSCIDDEISIGDFVMTGGELAAMVIIDALTRLVPGVLGNEDSAERDSFSNGLLAHGHFTRPPTFDGETVPDVLRSGNHTEIEKWRLEASLIRTFLKRPDLLQNRSFSSREIDILKHWCRDIEKIIQYQSLCSTGPLPGDQ
ncbi:tRNA (guanosine(37)-N1)-methyltransferase TrmD [Thermodesulfobacteriota bacterium]